MSESGTGDHGIARLQAQLQALTGTGEGAHPGWTELTPRLADLQRGLAALSSEVAGVQAGLETRLAEFEDALDSVGEAFDTLSRESAGAAEETATSVASLHSVLHSVRTDLGAALSEAVSALAGAVGSSVDDLAAALETIGEGVAERVGARVGTELAGLREQVENLAGAGLGAADMLALRGDLADALEEVRDRVAESSALRLDRLEERLTGAGRALLDYLIERDLALEAERDRVLHELLDDLTAGLTAGERRTLSGRASGLVERRRAERDAAHWRAASAGTRPAPLVDEDELVRRFGLDQDRAPGPPRPGPPRPPGRRRVSGESSTGKITEREPAAGSAGQRPARRKPAP